MDYFGQLVDDLTELQERIGASAYADEARPVLKALHRAMMIALVIERSHYSAQQEKTASLGIKADLGVALLGCAA